MRKPEMILFDYGNTLVYEPRFDKERGFSAVLSDLVSGQRTELQIPCSAGPDRACL